MCVAKRLSQRSIMSCTSESPRVVAFCSQNSCMRKAVLLPLWGLSEPRSGSTASCAPVIHTVTSLQRQGAIAKLWLEASHGTSGNFNKTFLAPKMGRSLKLKSWDHWSELTALDIDGPSSWLSFGHFFYNHHWPLSIIINHYLHEHQPSIFMIGHYQRDSLFHDQPPSTNS